MSYTNSLSFPNMFNITSGTVLVREDSDSVVNRTRLLILTEPTELYNNPQFGAGIRAFMWQYNNDNTVAHLRNKLIEQLRRYEPCAIPEDTQLNRGSVSEVDVEGYGKAPEINQLALVASVHTIFKDTVEVTLNDNIQ